MVKKEFSQAKAYASEYYQSYTPAAHFFNTRLIRASELLRDFKSGRVLDVGCGPGIIGNMFRDQPIEYCGIDISEDMIRECIDTFGCDPQFRFLLGRIEGLPFPDSCFDVVLCLGAFEYVTQGRDGLKEIVRVLKSKGIVIVTMLNKISPYVVWQRYGYGKIKCGTNKIMRRIMGGRSNWEAEIVKRANVRLYREKTFRDLLTSAGLEIDDIVYYDFNLFLPPLDARFPKAEVSLSDKLEFLGRSKLKFLGTGYMLRCSKK